MAKRFTAAYWRDHAEKALAVASEMTDADARRAMLEIAATYGSLAKCADELERPHEGKSSYFH